MKWEQKKGCEYILISTLALVGLLMMMAVVMVVVGRRGDGPWLVHFALESHMRDHYSRAATKTTTANISR